MSFIINAFRFAAAVVGWYSNADGANTDIVDTPNIQSGGTITIPSAWNGRRVRVSLAGNAAADLYAQKNSASFMGNPRTEVDAISGTNQKFATAHSAPVTVATGDAFGFSGQGSDTNNSWISVELLKSGLNCALLKRSTTLSIGTSLTQVTWDAEEYDDLAFHDNSTNTSRITIPSGTTGLFRFTANLQVNSSGGEIQIELRINGSKLNYICPRVDLAGDYINLISPPIALSAGDYVEVYALTTSSSTLQTGNNSWFAVEELESGLQYAIAGRSSNGSGMTASTDTLQPMNNEAVNVGGWFTSGNSNFVVPSGVTAVRMGGHGTHGASSSGTWNLWITKNGTGNFPGMFRAGAENAGTDNVCGASTIIVTSSGVQYDFYARTNAGAQFFATGGAYWIEEAKDYS